MENGKALQTEDTPCIICMNISMHVGVCVCVCVAKATAKPFP